MAKINERIVNPDDLKNTEKEEKAATKLVKEQQEYGEIRVPKTWKNPPKLADLKHDIEYAVIEHIEVIKEINDYLSYYHTTPDGVGRPKKVEGRSNAQPQSIRKAAEWRYAHLSEPFLDSPNIFNANPTTHLDIEGTKQAKVLLNYQFKHQIDLQGFVDDYIKDLVDTGTAIIRTSWETEERKREVDVDVVRYDDAPEFEEAYARLMDLMAEDPDTFNKQVTPAMAKTLMVSSEEGRPLKRVVIKTEKQMIVETVKNQPHLEICDYRDVIPDPTCKGKQEKMNFCGFRIRTTKAELKKDPRYSNVDDIMVSPAIAAAHDNSLGWNGEDTDQDSESFQFKDPNRQPILGIEYWGFVDVDDSGILTPVVFTWFGDVLVRAEENPYPDKQIPFTFVPYLKKRNSLYGEPDGVLLHEDQKISGAITRGVIDILAKNANGQRGIPKGALDFSNLMLYRAGQDYEYNAGAVQGRDGIATVTKFAEIPASAIAIKDRHENEIKEMTGTVQGTGSASHGNQIGDTIDGTAPKTLSKAARRELGILRRISGGFITVGHKICAMNKEFLDDEEIIRVTDDNFLTVDRGELDCRYDLTLGISTAEDDAAKAAELSFMLQTTGQTMDDAFQREILADIADLRRMPEMAQKYRNFKSQPSEFEQQMQALQLEEQQAKIEEIRSRTRENLAEAEREMSNAGKLEKDGNLSQSKADAIDLKYVEDNSGVTHQRDLEKAGAQAQANKGLESHKAALKRGEKVLSDQDDEDKEILSPAATPAPAPNTIDNLQDNLTEDENASTNVTVPEDDSDLESASPEQLVEELDNIGNTRELTEL